MNIDALRGITAKKLRTQRALSTALGWTENKVSKMFTGKYVPDVNEAADMAVKLNLTKEEYQEIFLPKASPNGDNIRRA